MKGITHKRAVHVLHILCGDKATRKQKEVLADLVALGTEETVQEASIKRLEQFICLLYRSEADTLDDARPVCLRKKKGHPSAVMSTSNSFYQRCFRVFYQVVLS